LFMLARGWLGWDMREDSRGSSIYNSHKISNISQL
jgi:hypothetical protein